MLWKKRLWVTLLGLTSPWNDLFISKFEPFGPKDSESAEETKSSDLYSSYVGTKPGVSSVSEVSIAHQQNIYISVFVGLMRHWEALIGMNVTPSPTLYPDFNCVIHGLGLAGRAGEWSQGQLLAES